MAEYKGGGAHGYSYVPDAGDKAGEFLEKFIKEVNERKGPFQAEAKTLSIGLISKKERKAVFVTGLDTRAWITPFTVGPDLYIGHTVEYPAKEKLNEIENQNREAFHEYLRHVIQIAFGKI